MCWPPRASWGRGEKDNSLTGCRRRCGCSGPSYDGEAGCHRGADAVHRRGGRPARRGRQIDIAVDRRGHEPRSPTARAIHDGSRPASEKWPDSRRGCTSRSSASGPSLLGRSTSAEPDREASGGSPAPPAGQRHHDRHPRPAPPRVADRRGPRGRRPDQAHHHGDLSAAISCAVSGTGVHAVMDGGAPQGRPHRRGAALPGRRDPGPLPLPQPRGGGPRRRRRPRRRGPRHDEAAASAISLSSRRPA